MKPKKYLILALCIFILGTFISACGGGGLSADAAPVWSAPYRESGYAMPLLVAVYVGSHLFLYDGV